MNSSSSTTCECFLRVFSGGAPAFIQKRPAAIIPPAMNSCKRPSKCCWSGKSERTLGRRWCGLEGKCQRANGLCSEMASLRLWWKDAATYGLRVLRFTSRGGFHEALSRLGHIPLPPYIKRADDLLDRERYQTVYAKQGCAIAAPTAGLHFTPEIIAELRRRGIEIAEITLEVGLGTFEPVRTENIEDHAIHAEAYEIPVETASALCRAKRGRRPVLAVGTTVVRALEDAAAKNSGSQEPVAAGKSKAEILLYPGKPFRVVNQLLTNFHLPRSSLLALVAAFAGRENILRAYRHAVESGYRFYSYGDSMLIR